MCKKRSILVTGCNGYIGNAITQKLLEQGHKVVGIDNNTKEAWLTELNSVSAISVFKGKEKAEKLLSMYDSYQYYNIDVFYNVESLEQIFQLHEFDTIINLGQMPAAPYSQISLDHSSWTIKNNTMGTLNLLWMIKDYCPDAHLIEIESMGTFDPTIGVDIPENKFQFEFNGKKSKPCIFPKQAGSFYHASKIFNTYLNDCANRFWGIKSTIINQGVVYGNYSDEIVQTGIHSHLSVDECFGTVINRFIVQAILNEPLTIYGDGEQKRGFLALNDSVQCLDLFVKNPPKEKEMRIVNQLDEVFSMNEIADKVINTFKKEFDIEVTKTNIESPRVENTNDFYYNPHTEILKSLGFKQTRTIEDEIKFAWQHFDVSTFNKLRENVIPKIKWI